MQPMPIRPPATRRWWVLPLIAAAALAGCAAVVRHQTRKAERAYPPQGRFMRVDGVRLHYRVHGPDEATQHVVLLHGNGTMGEDFELSGLVEEAAQRYRVWVFDRPGFGYSTRPADRPWRPQEQADLIHAALQQLGVQRPVVLGHSWGAHVALALGVLHPQDVAALVLASGYYTPSLRLDVALMSPPALPLIGALMRHTVSPLLGRLLWPLSMRRLFSPAPTAQAFQEGYPVWMSLRPSQLRASAAESARMIPSAWSLRRHHRTMQVPTVVIAGAGDRLVNTRWHSSLLAGRLSRSWLRVVEGAGHMVHHSAPHQVMAALHQAAELGWAQPKRVERAGATGSDAPVPSAL